METNAEKTQELSNKFGQEVTRFADLLRRTADEVERHGSNVRLNLRDLNPDHLAAAIEIVNDMRSLQGNLNTTDLLAAAREADMQARGVRNG